MKGKSVNETPTKNQLKKMEERVQSYMKQLLMMNEIVYVDYPDYDLFNSNPINNGHHATLNVQFKKNRFVEGQPESVSDDFVKFTEKFFKGFWVQWNNHRTTFAIWYEKKGK